MDWYTLVNTGITFVIAYILYVILHIDNWKELKFLRRYVKELVAKISNKTKVVYVIENNNTNTINIETMNKSLLIDTLKCYIEDYELTEDDSLQKVIEWFINCTPDYKE